MDETVLAKEAFLNETVFAEAVSLGRTHRFDEKHAVHVTRLAMQVFDQLREAFSLTPEDKKLLFTAAILHDIGQSVDYETHHKASRDLIMNARFASITAKEIRVVAAVARYHRKSVPKASHKEFAALPAHDQQTVLKLSALLRIADALDHDHLQRIRSITVSVEKPVILLELHGESASGYEQSVLEKKARLFSEVFGYTIRVKQVSA